MSEPFHSTSFDQINGNMLPMLLCLVCYVLRTLFIILCVSVWWPFWYLITTPTRPVVLMSIIFPFFHLSFFFRNGVVLETTENWTTFEYLVNKNESSNMRRPSNTNSLLIENFIHSFRIFFSSISRSINNSEYNNKCCLHSFFVFFFFHFARHE